MYNKTLVFSAACMSMLLFGIVMISIGAILPAVSAKLQLSDAQQGFVATMLPLGILVGSIVFGPVVDRFGYKQVLIISAILVLCGLEGIGFARDPWMVVCAILLIAVAGGAINGATNALSADLSADYKSANLSLLGVFYGVGAICMPLALSALSKHFSSEAIIKGVGAAVAIPVGYLTAVKFPKPKHTQRIPLSSYLKLVKEKALLLFGFVLFFQSAAEGLINNWSTSYFKGSIGEDKALLALLAIPVAMTVTRLAFGVILRKLNPALVLTLSVIVAIAGSLLLNVAHTQVTATLALALFGVGLSAGFPVVLGYVGQLYAGMSGTAFSIALVIALTGNTLLNYLTGRLIQHSGMSVFPYIMTATLLALLLVFTVAKKKG